MVLSSSKPTSTTPALSYADSAKKAHNVRPSPAVQKIAPHPVAPPASSSASTLSSVAASSTLSPSKSSPTSRNADSTPISSRVSGSRSRPSSPTNDPSTKIVNGNAHIIDASDGDSLSKIKPVNPQKFTPPVNVWSIRMEQMALAQAQGDAKPHFRSRSSPPPSSGRKTLPQDQTRPPASAQSRRAPGTAVSPSRNLDQSNQSQQTKQVATIKGVKGAQSEPADDPFVVRPPPHISRQSQPGGLSLLSGDDVESWPTVGKSPPSTDSTRNDVSNAEPNAEMKRDDESNKHAESSQSKKSEKAKWVPIPPKELQAAADAAKRSANRQARNLQAQGQHVPASNYPASQTASSSGSGSTPGQVSEDRSYDQSSHTSATHSDSQSRMQSRNGSVQSSPMIQAARGGRLPVVTGSSGYSNAALNQVNKSSPHPDAGDQAAYPSHGPSSTPSRPSTGHGSSYYVPPPMLPPAPHAMPQQTYPQPPSPSMRSPFSLPLPGNYSNHSSAPHAPPHLSLLQPGYPGAVTPPYPMYPPYSPYEYGHPYMYWNSGPQNLGREHTPPYAPPHYSISPAEQTLQYRRFEGDARSYDIPLPPPLDGSQPVTWNKPTMYGQTVSHGPDSEERRAPIPDSDNLPTGVVFGSIGLRDFEKSPSPAPFSPLEVSSVEQKDLNGTGQGQLAQNGQAENKPVEQPIFTFAIGVAPGELDSARTGTRKRQSKGAADANGGPMSDLTNKTIEGSPQHEHGNNKDASESVKPELKVIDLTDHDTKWEFGTIKQSLVAESSALEQRDEGTTLLLDASPMRSTPVSDSVYSPQPQNGPSGSQAPLDIPPGAPAYQFAHMGQSSDDHVGSSLLNSEDDASVNDEWEVKDYGYGFGDASGSGYAPVMTKEERLARERERDREREEKNKELYYMHQEKEREWDRGERQFTRPRRGSFVGSYSGYDRGGFAGRRGRGNYGGRGFGSRNYNRGGYHSHQQRSHSFSVTPPHQFHALGPHGESANGYYPYMHLPFDAYQPSPTVNSAVSPTGPMGPPLPLPVSVVPFPLDPTRSYLLGQLEYYLSPQNMAQDFFLRQRMDKRGWIPIPLIASFNRIRQLTTDLQLVKDVLSLSSVVEVQDNWVRMGGRQWEQFVLPDAQQSLVEEPYHYDQPQGPAPWQGDHGAEAESEVEEGDEEDEEDVVFVIGEEAEGSWTPERRQS